MIEISVRHAFKAFALDAEFRIDRPGVTALFGPSGSGKTTLVNAVAGIFRPDQGRIVVDGRVLLDTASGTFVPARARRAGTVFQDARLFPHMSVENNLRFGWRRAQDKASEQDFAHIIDMLGLAPLLSRRPAKLSGGETSRVALGRALLASPALLLLDEPLAALDAARRSEILPYLERLRDETKLPMIHVTHSLDEVARLADDIVVLEDGHVVAQGRVFDLLPDLDVAGSPGAVFAAQIAAQRDDGLTALAFDGGTLAVARLDRPMGSKLRVRLRAEDILLALEEPRAISANNVLPAVVTKVSPRGAQADVQLHCGATKLVARITQASAARLGLRAGTRLFAIVKSVTVDPILS
jgi:molybdate transport system ATP-binding protein